MVCHRSLQRDQICSEGMVEFVGRLLGRRWCFGKVERGDIGKGYGWKVDGDFEGGGIGVEIEAIRGDVEGRTER